MGRDVTITEVMQVSGMSSATLRYYERRGLIESRGRRGGRRLYDPEVFDRLGLIALSRRAGFSVEEVAGIVGAKRVSRSGLEARAKVVEELIGQMLALRAPVLVFEQGLNVFFLAKVGPQGGRDINLGIRDLP